MHVQSYGLLTMALWGRKWLDNILQMRTMTIRKTYKLTQVHIAGESRVETHPSWGSRQGDHVLPPTPGLPPQWVVYVRSTGNHERIWMGDQGIWFLPDTDFSGGAVVKNPSANAGDARDVGSIPGLGRSPGVGNGNPLQYSSWKIPWREEPGGLQSMGP